MILRRVWFMIVILLCLCMFAHPPSLTCQMGWENHWHNGISYQAAECFLEASKEFDLAIQMMSEEELHEFPFVLIDRAENDYLLGLDAKVFEDTEKALQSPNLTDYERLMCGLKRIAILNKQSRDEEAIEEYKKYIINCPLFPLYSFSNKKIIIRNRPNCDLYRNASKKLMLEKFCHQESDIQDYGNTCIINITKNPGCIPCKMQARNQAQVQACCNTCNKLAVAASAICGCLSVPFGPITNATCKIACVYFIEEIRQVCEWCCHNGGIEGKCWEKFETWKIDFNQKNPNCPYPPKSCN